MSGPDAAAADVLDRAADLLEPEGAWTQGEDARSESGQPVRPDDPVAVCWCVSGAIKKVGGRYEAKADEALRSMLPRRAMTDWNDANDRTQAEVIARLREAAAKARGQL